MDNASALHADGFGGIEAEDLCPRSIFKRCDRCGRISDLANTPQPQGWVTLSDSGLGTNTCFDFCADCLEATGMAGAMRDRLRHRVVEQFKFLMQPDVMPELSRSLHYDEIVEKAMAGDFDEAFALGDGIDLAAEIADLEPAEAELVEAEELVE